MNTSESLDQFLPDYIKAKSSFDEPVKDCINTYITTYTYPDGIPYASYNACLAAVEPALHANNCFITHDTYMQDVIEETDEDNRSRLIRMVVVTTRIWHVSGQWIEAAVHLEPVATPALHKATGKVLVQIKPQSMGSGISYGKRYGLKMLCALGDTEQEDDATLATNGTPGTSDDKLTVEQIGVLNKLLKKSGADYANFLGFLGVPGISELKQGKFDMAVNALKRKIQANKEEQTNG